MILPRNYKITHLDSGWLVKDNEGYTRAFSSFEEILKSLNYYSQFQEVVIDIKVIREIGKTK